jgi:hypothetical protein
MATRSKDALRLSLLESTVDRLRDELTRDRQERHAVVEPIQRFLALQKKVREDGLTSAEGAAEHAVQLWLDDVVNQCPDCWGETTRCPRHAIETTGLVGHITTEIHTLCEKLEEMNGELGEIAEKAVKLREDFEALSFELKKYRK